MTMTYNVTYHDTVDVDVL